MVPKVNSVAAAKLASAPLFSLKIHSRQPTHATGCGPLFRLRYRTYAQDQEPAPSASAMKANLVLLQR